MIDVEALKAKVDLTALVGHFVKLEKAGTEWKGLCPFHADKNPSFYVSPVKGFCHCFACGANHDAISFVQEIQGVDFKGAVEFLDSNPPLQPQLSKPERPPLPDRVTSKPPPDAGKPNMTIKKLGEPSRVWEYKDTDGGTLGYVARYETEEGKEIRCWSFGARGSEKPVWGCGHWSKPRPLYQLELLWKRSNAPVCAVEGEKACDAAQKLLPGYVVCTWPGGAQAWKHADLTVLRGKTVLLWPDNDEPGIKAMQGIAAVISDPKGLGCTVRIIDPSGMPDGFDAADWTGTTEDLIAWAKPRASDYTHKSAELSTDQTGATVPDEQASGAPQVPLIDNALGSGKTGSQLAPDQSSAAQTSPEALTLSPSAAHALDPAEAFTGPTSDDPPPDLAEIPPPEGSTPTRPPRKPRKPRKPYLASANGNTVSALDPDAEVLPQALTEHGAAKEFAELYEDTFRCCHEWASKHGPMWLTWDGTRWKRDPNRVVAMQKAEGLAAQYQYRPEAGGMTTAAKTKFGTKKYIANFLDLAQYDSRLIAPADVFDADPMLLGTPDGTVDLRTGKLIDAEREHYLTRQTTVSPWPGEHPLFDDVVRRASGGDDATQQYIWRWLGVFLMGMVPFKGFLFLWGKRDSGKTTLIETVAGILGKTQNGGYSTTIDMELLTESKHDKGNEKLAHLFGARLAYASETEEGRHWKASLLKLVTGKDTLEGRFLYSEKFSFKPSHKLVIFGNERPHLKQKDEGVETRMHLLEYPGVIAPEDQDPRIDEKLVAEYPAILHSMIAGCLDLQANGLGKPKAVSDAVARYMDNEDTLELWLSECAERIPDALTLAGTAFRSFRTWAEANGSPVFSQKRFGAAMEGKGFERHRTADARYIKGMKLKRSDDDRNPPPYGYRDD